MQKCEDYNRDPLAAYLETGYCIKTAGCSRMDLIKCELVPSGSGMGAVEERCECGNRRAVIITTRGLQDLPDDFSRNTLLHVASLVVCVHKWCS